MNKQSLIGATWSLISLLALVVFSLSLAFCSPVKAQTDLIVGGWSYHLDREKNYNEVHNNIGVKVDGYTLMYYKNSGDHDTIAFGKDILPWEIAGQSVGFTPVLLTGYLDGGEPAPMVFATITGHLVDGWGYEFHTAGVVSQVSFTYRLNHEHSEWSTSGKTNYAISYGYGLLGGTASAYYRINDQLTARGSFTTSKHGWDDRWDHWEDGAWLYQQEHLRPRFYGLNIDYAPFKGDFIVYGGIGINDTTYNTTYHAYTDKGGDTCGQVNIAHTPATVCHGDKLYGHVEWGDVTGSAGVRWGNPFTQSGWDWYVDLGVQTMDGITCQAIYDGRGSVTQEQLTAFEDKECAKYDDLISVVPRAELGVSYRF